MQLEDTRASFETIRNNTALKHRVAVHVLLAGFETIRNNTALKLGLTEDQAKSGFETIRNNTALKQKMPFYRF